MSAWGSPLWHEDVQPPQRRNGVPRRIVIGDLGAAEARRGEWTAPPPSRLGRGLLADIEPYLGFFAIARAD